MSNTPTLRFGEFDGEWSEKRLGEIAIINMGQSPDSKSYNLKNIGVPLIQGNADIKNRVSYPRQYTDSPTKICNIGDLILTVRAPVGAVGKSIHRACIGRGVCAIESNQNSNLEFIYQKLLDYESKWKSLEQGSTFTAVSGKDIKNLKLSLPTKPEQQKIAIFLSAVDSSIEQLSLKEKLLRAYKKGVMQKIFSRQIRFKRDDGGEFEDWVEKRLGEVLKIGSGKDYKHLEAGDIPVYGTGGHMTSVDSYLYDGKSVCIGRKGTINKPIMLDGKFWTVDTLFYTHSYKGLLVEYFYHFALTINWLKYNEGTTLPSLSKKTIEKIKINLPSLQEQTKIANFLSSLDKQIEQVSTQLAETKSFKRGLLQRMFV